MVARFPGIGDWLERWRAAFRAGAEESPEPLPFIARLPIIRGMVEREIGRIAEQEAWFVKRLRNVDLIRDPLAVDVTEAVPGEREALSATVTIITPDGRVLTSDVRLPFGTKYDDFDFKHRLVSSFADRGWTGDPRMTEKILSYVVHVDWYIEYYHAI
jgi:hypothetical protein